MRRLRLLLQLCLPVITIFGLNACNSPPPEPVVTTGQSTPASTVPAWPGYSWRLPKTVLSVAVSYTLTDCTVTEGIVHPVTKIDATIQANAEPDLYLGPDLPDGWVSRSADDLSSFWSNTSFSLETDPKTRILTHLVSSPSNQAVTIIGNTISGVTKLAAAGLGVPTAAGAAALAGPPPCIDVKTINKRIAQNKLLLAGLAGQTSAAAVARQSALAQAISDDTKSLTISFSCDIDPGITLVSMPKAGQHCPKTPTFVPGKDPSHALAPDGLIGVVLMTTDDIAKTKWIIGYNPTDPKVDLTDQQVGIYLDFDHAHPDAVARCPGEAKSCIRHRVIVGKDTMFREVAYINVTTSIIKQSNGNIVRDNSKQQPSKPVLFPFAQFGVPRTVALIAGFAQSPTWDIAFNTLGEMGTTKAGATAFGLGLSTLFGSATGGASAILTEVRSSESTVDPTLQGQAATAQALYNLANAKAQLMQLCQKNYMPGVCP